MSHTRSDDSLFANSFHPTINSLGRICMSETLLNFLLYQCLKSRNSGHYPTSICMLLVLMYVLLLQQSNSRCCYWKLPPKELNTLQNPGNLMSPDSQMNFKKESKHLRPPFLNKREHAGTWAVIYKF